MEYKDVVGALYACSNGKGNRCSQCPIFGKGQQGVCARNLMRNSANMIENLTREIFEKEIEMNGLRLKIAQERTMSETGKRSCYLQNGGNYVSK